MYQKCTLPLDPELGRFLFQPIKAAGTYIDTTRHYQEGLDPKAFEHVSFYLFNAASIDRTNLDFNSSLVRINR